MAASEDGERRGVTARGSPHDDVDLGTPATSSARSRSRPCAAAQPALPRGARRLRRRSQASDKADRSPVTVADLAAQALVSAMLADAFPDDGLMGEEDSAPLRGLTVSWQRPCSSGSGRTAPGSRWPRSPRPSTAAPTRADRAAAGGRSTRSTGRRASCATSSTPSRSRSSRTARSCSPRWAPRTCRRRARRVNRADRMRVRRGARPRRLCSCALDAIDADGTPARGHADHGGADRGRRRRPLRRVGRGGPFARSPRPRSSPSGWASPPSRCASTARRSTRSSRAARPRSTCASRTADYRENVWDHAAGSLVVAEAGGRVCDADGRPLDFTRGRRLDAQPRDRGVRGSGGPRAPSSEAVAAVLGADGAIERRHGGVRARPSGDDVRGGEPLADRPRRAIRAARRGPVGPERIDEGARHDDAVGERASVRACAGRETPKPDRDRDRADRADRRAGIARRRAAGACARR